MLQLISYIPIFWSILPTSIFYLLSFRVDAQLCPEDEFYEREVISTNRVYKLQEGDPPHLIPVAELCGYMPRIGILNTKEV